MSDESPRPDAEVTDDWIDQLSDSECMEVFWLYVDPPEDFLARHPPALLGKAMRHALRLVSKWADSPRSD